MAQKYEIYHETGWNEHDQSPEYEKLTTLKNEQSAIDFISDVDNIGKYGNMFIRLKAKGNTWVYNERLSMWEQYA